MCAPLRSHKSRKLNKKIQTALMRVSPQLEPRQNRHHHHQAMPLICEYVYSNTTHMIKHSLFLVLNTTHTPLHSTKHMRSRAADCRGICGCVVCVSCGVCCMLRQIPVRSWYAPAHQRREATAPRPSFTQRRPQFVCYRRTRNIAYIRAHARPRLRMSVKHTSFCVVVKSAREKKVPCATQGDTPGARTFRQHHHRPHHNHH